MPTICQQQDATLSQGVLRDAAVNFGMYQSFQWHLRTRNSAAATASGCDVARTSKKISKRLKILTLTPHLYRPNFGGVSVAPDRPCWGQPSHRP